MTDRERLQAAWRTLGLTQARFAALVGYSVTTVSGWGTSMRSGRGEQAVPAWAWLLLDAWQRDPSLIPPP